MTIQHNSSIRNILTAHDNTFTSQNQEWMTDEVIIAQKSEHNYCDNIKFDD